MGPHSLLHGCFNFFPYLPGDVFNLNNSMALAHERTIPSDFRLSTKLVPTFVDRGHRVIKATDPHGCILGFLDRNRLFLLNSSSIVLTWLSGPCSRPTTTQKIWYRRELNVIKYLTVNKHS
jgi:hypothetical protein